jgi:hypothetical protein
VQLTSTTYLTPSPRASASALRMARLDRPATAALIAFAG